MLPKAKAKPKAAPKEKVALSKDLMDMLDVILQDTVDDDKVVSSGKCPELDAAIKKSGRKYNKTNKNIAVAVIVAKTPAAYLKALQEYYPQVKEGDYLIGTQFSKKEIREVLNDFFTGIKGGHSIKGDVWAYLKIPQK